VTAQFDWNTTDDAELACAAAAGDRTAWAGIYDRYADRLHDFCVGMVGVRDAADCVQEAFCSAAVDIRALRDPDKLRPWLYSIARHQALRVLRARRREVVSDELPDEPSGDAGPDTLAARNELAALVGQAEAGLSDRDREVLDLVYRHGLTGAELAQALGVSGGSAKKMVQRLRDTVERSLGALLVARQASSGHNQCPELATIVAGWDGQFTILLRKRIARHLESCADCDQDRGRLVSPAALLGASALFIPAPSGLRAQTLNQIPLAHVSTTGTAGMGAQALGHASARLPVVGARFVVWAAAIVAAPALVVGVMFNWPALRDEPASTVQVTSAVPAASTQPQPHTVAPTPSVLAPQPGTGTSGTTDSPGSRPDLQAPSPAPRVSVAPQEPTTPPTHHTAPASLTPSSSNAPPSVASPPSRAAGSSRAAPPSRATPPAQGPLQPPAKQCPGGNTVAGGQSCPSPVAPAPPKCPHAVVPGNPVCGRTAAGG